MLKKKIEAFFSSTYLIKHHILMTYGGVKV